jgi:hypothetical protein
MRRAIISLYRSIEAERKKGFVPKPTQQGLVLSSLLTERLQQIPPGLMLYSDPLDLIKRDFIGSAIVELGRAWALVRGDRLRMFKRTAI